MLILPTLQIITQMQIIFQGTNCSLITSKMLLVKNVLAMLKKCDKTGNNWKKPDKRSAK